MHETCRNSRGAGSSPMCCSPAFCAREIVGGSACVSGFERILRKSLEASLAARGCKDAEGQTSFWSRAEIAAPATATVVGRAKAGYAALGVSAGGMERPFGAAPDSAAVRRGLSSRLCRYAAAHARLESAEAGATRPRTPRSRNRPLAERALAATKKRAPHGKLAWYLSTKAAFCCSPCGVVCGPSAATLPCNMLGTGTTESPRWQ